MKQITLIAGALLALLFISACSSADDAARSKDDAYVQLVDEILEDSFARSPANATTLGIHRYDDRLDDLRPEAIAASVERLRAFGARLDAIDPKSLAEDDRIDRDFLRKQIDASILQLDVVKNWRRDPDSYSSVVTNGAYILMKRNFAPAAERLRLVIAREEKASAVLALAKTNLQNPPRIFTEIAIQQIDGNVSFFTNDLPLAFADVKDAALTARFKETNAAVIAALIDYKDWLSRDLLPRSNGTFALGEDTYRKLLDATEMVTEPLDDLLAKAEADLLRNQAMMTETAKKIDPARSVEETLAAIQVEHPAPRDLIATTQATLDGLLRFIEAKKIMTIPPAPSARVQETPPFMRATTSASMDTPGPFEAEGSDAFYSMTLPDPAWSAADQEDFMRQWYTAMITNVSVHEVYPGHYVQFLYAKRFPTLVRKVFGANTNIEGWAHYTEQMMLDEGLHAEDPRYRLSQLQDALLRDVRFVVGIKMHTRGMSIDEAIRMFETAAHQPHPVAVSEAKRGTNDALYGYYTMGKLAILGLREDWRKAKGAAYSLAEFHDAFIKIGPLPIPLIRRILLPDAR